MNRLLLVLRHACPERLTILSISRACEEGYFTTLEGIQKSRVNDSQILAVLKQAGTGVRVDPGAYVVGFSRRVMQSAIETNKLTLSR